MPARPGSARRLAADCACALIRLYQQLVSPVAHALFGPCGCRFHPSCSEYVCQAIATHGLARGLRLGFLRLARCHPWGGAGVDPVPAHEPSDCAAARRI